MSSPTDETDPGIKTKAKRVGEKAKDAAKRADPYADRLLGHITGSEWSAVWVVLIVLALVGGGMWAAW